MSSLALGVAIMEQIDLNALRLLIQIVQAGSLGQAQKKLGLAKSTLSRRLSQFEKQLNLKLVERELTGISLTDAGQRLVSQTSDLIAGLAEAEDFLAGLHVQPKGRIRISAPLEFGINFISPLVSQYAALYPDVEVDIDVSQERRDLIKDKVDVALRFYLRVEDEKYVAKELTQISMSLYCSPGFYEEYQPEPLLQKLIQYPCVCSRPGELWPFILKGEVVNQAVYGRYFSASTTFKRDAVMAGIGIGLLPDFLCEKALSLGELVKLRVQAQPIKVPIYAVYQASSFQNPKLYRFLELIEQELPKAYPSENIEVT